MAKYRYVARGIIGQGADKWPALVRGLEEVAEEIEKYGQSLEQVDQVVTFAAYPRDVAALFNRLELIPIGILAINVNSWAEPVRGLDEGERAENP